MSIDRPGGMELVVRGDSEVVGVLVETFFVGRGWRPRPRGEGRVDYECGSRRRTLLLGGLAGRRFFLTAQVALTGSGRRAGSEGDAEAEGRTVARYTWGAGEGRWLGGSLGRARALRVHAATARALEAELDRTGRLLAVRGLPGS
ncbi:hypothetical protein BH708_10095 [Brachybacterium sp. P6-10-X1]|uniref:hypothetical protein n=1 Tax=Brachybacterium sp. P6-10-X1 TaxID=1903186 RepID=UPI000971870B|nr:hypothetical protein [Brachybacterium sp. P6-10-X1]APX32997.1 hypothetical protein BH708_10095 [Brachybacterium sp. P6-10-X1]